MAVLDRFKRVWNAFKAEEASSVERVYYEYGPSSTWRPDRNSLRYSNERTIVSSIYTRISIDVASIDLRHIKLDDQDRYQEDMDTELNSCFFLEPNLDQAPRA